MTADSPADTRMHYASASFEIKSGEFKQADEESGSFGYFEGYASTFNAIDRAFDKVMPGAFTDTIADGRRVKMLWQHDTKDLIGSFISLAEDGRGLWVKGRINLGTQQGREAYALLKAGDIDTLSIGYKVLNRTFQSGIRVLNKLELGEISIVTDPANLQARVLNVKSFSDVSSLASIEGQLRAKGFSRREVRRVVNGIKQFAGPRQAGGDEAGEEAQCEAVQETPVQASEPLQCEAAEGLPVETDSAPASDESEVKSVDRTPVLQAIRNLTQTIKGKQ